MFMYSSRIRPPQSGGGVYPFRQGPIHGAGDKPLRGEGRRRTPTAASHVGVLRRLPNRLRALRDAPPGKGGSRADSMPLCRGYRAAFAVC
jgi:hypothetical protein